MYTDDDQGNAVEVVPEGPDPEEGPINYNGEITI